MQLLINTDSSLQGDDRVEEYVGSEVEKSLRRFKNEVTRLEVHLADEASKKNGSKDKRCTIEARIQGKPPVAVTEYADSYRTVIQGAVHKLERALDTTLGKRSNHRK